MSFAVVAIPFTYGFRMVRVHGHSMDPTFHNGQWLLVRRLNWPSPPLKVGDVVVFHKDGELLVKRVAALGGELIPAEQQLPLIRRSPRHPGRWLQPVAATAERVPEGQLYVLGDNPPVSDDSRSFGPVPVSTLIGRVIRWKDPGPPGD